MSQSLLHVHAPFIFHVAKYPSTSECRLMIVLLLIWLDFLPSTVVGVFAVSPLTYGALSFQNHTNTIFTHISYDHYYHAHVFYQIMLYVDM